MRAILAASTAAWLICAPAHAHDFWDNGEPVDPVTKAKCCGKSDCRSIQPSEAQETEGGWKVLDAHGVWRFLSTDRVQPSPDGNFHVCEWGALDSYSSSAEVSTATAGRIKCFFAPMAY
jgi:hypothetical protein